VCVPADGGDGGILGLLCRSVCVTVELVTSCAPQSLAVLRAKGIHNPLSIILSFTKYGYWLVLITEYLMYCRVPGFFAVV
jgi:hypothetical protein